MTGLVSSVFNLADFSFVISATAPIQIKVNGILFVLLTAKIILENSAAEIISQSLRIIHIPG